MLSLLLLRCLLWLSVCLSLVLRMVCSAAFSECNSTSPLPCRGSEPPAPAGILTPILIMKKKIIKILSVISVVVIISVCLFAFPASADVGDVVWSKHSMDELLAKDESFGSDEFNFTMIEAGYASADVYRAGTAIVSKLNNSGLFLGGELLFPTVDSSKYYNVRLPLTFSNMAYDLRPSQVIINLYDGDKKLVRQVGLSKYLAATIGSYNIQVRTFDFNFNIAGAELNKCEYIEFFITVENFNSVNSYIYFGIYKNNGMYLSETLSDDTQAIINNQNENTDKIINGGSDNPHYEKPDGSSVNEEKELTNQIEFATQDGINSTNNLFASFNGLFSAGGHVSNGLLAVTAFMNELLAIPWLASILNFALTLGILSFLLGMGFFIGNVARVGKDKYSANKHSHKPSNWKGKMSSEERSFWV